MKTCSKCKILKNESEFYKHKNTKDGLQSYCKKCMIKFRKNYRMNNSIKIQNIYRKYRKTKRYKTLKVLQYERYKTKYPEKEKARYDLGYAVQHGKIQKPNKCSICNIEYKNIHGHHFDYTKPLKVIWCCQQCHINIHKKINKK